MNQICELRFRWLYITDMIFLTHISINSSPFSFFFSLFFENIHSQCNNLYLHFTLNKDKFYRNWNSVIKYALLFQSELYAKETRRSLRYLHIQFLSRLINWLNFAWFSLHFTWNNIAREKNSFFFFSQSLNNTATALTLNRYSSGCTRLRLFDFRNPRCPRSIIDSQRHFHFPRIFHFQPLHPLALPVLSVREDISQSPRLKISKSN